MNNIHKKLNKVAVLGPHDRMNYGDFLFPIVLDYCFSRFSNSSIELKKYSLINADFSKIGAFSSKNIRTLKNDINKGNIDYIIIAGGECLGADWDILYYYINPYYNFFYDKIKKVKIKNIYKKIPRYLLGGNTKYPFSFNAKNFENKNLKIFYNAVGGAWRVSNDILQDLNTADVLNVRDIMSFDKLYQNKINANLCPDSAVVLSKIFNKCDLTKMLKFDYIFFQISKYHLINDQDVIIEQLREINKKSGYKILLCSIGNALGHEDHIILKQINEKIGNISIFIDRPAIKDIISFIAYSKLYLGTSLHGVITAMNYGIPYLGLDKNVKKQINYIKTWSIDELKFSFLNDLSDLSEVANRLLSLDISKNILKKNKENQILYFEKFELIYNGIVNEA